MTFKRFEDLPVWKSAMDLAVRVYALTRHRVFRGPGDLRSQLRRAALSVSNNIAEGFERGTTAELLTFLYIARGSAGEVRSMLHFVGRLLEERHTETENTLRRSDGRISDLKSEISDLVILAESCARQIRAWADSLQNSDITGQRHFTEKSKRVFEQERRADAFWKQVEQAAKSRSIKQQADDR